MFKLLLHGGLNFNKSILNRPILVNKLSIVLRKEGLVEKREENDSKMLTI